MSVYINDFIWWCVCVQPEMFYCFVLEPNSLNVSLGADNKLLHWVWGRWLQFIVFLSLCECRVTQTAANWHVSDWLCSFFTERLILMKRGLAKVYYYIKGLFLRVKAFPHLFFVLLKRSWIFTSSQWPLPPSGDPSSTVLLWADEQQDLSWYTWSLYYIQYFMQMSVLYRWCLGVTVNGEKSQIGYLNFEP